MPWKWHVLVVANVTAGSQELVGALRKRSEQRSLSIHLVVPATPFGGGRAAAGKTLTDALAQLHDAGLEATGAVGHPDPVTATLDAWDPRRYDEIVVSTLPIGSSKWLRAGLPARIESLTGATVTHVISQPPGHAVQAGPAPERKDSSVVMGALSVLGWGSTPSRR